jgi:hypothetical protein
MIKISNNPSLITLRSANLYLEILLIGKRTIHKKFITVLSLNLV